ncbi:hypothetical protein CPB84DRAFT_1813168 [Gymnopilus junonius]|uniref:Borealin N-terminal domain-containing protein n=1 Tax=Gymnopilus junonius TaxID=109634 RepID=A0A9P5NW80_GYMJU|nr:hypothetical protein CPB84DRAFT_1813168 [Gymnopilus junonius]
MEFPTTKRHYSNEEKRQLIENLDIEVAHRTRQFEAWLSDKLEHFTIHQEGQVSRIPKQVRSMTMREFGVKYEGNIQLALRGYQKERLAAAGADASFGEIDKSMRKRKWVASHEVDAEASGSGQLKDTDSQRRPKNARIQPASPQKVAGSSTGPGTAQHSRMTRSMGRIPQTGQSFETQAPFQQYDIFAESTTNSRLASPLKQTSSYPNLVPQQNRVPSSSTSNTDRTAMRLPRKDESMLSINGSPLANPYEFGLGWFKGIEMAELELEEEDPQDEQLRTKSSIIIRRDPSVVFPMSGLHSRTDSQTSFYTASSSQTTSSSSSRSRENSQAPVPNAPRTNLETFRFPPAKQDNGIEATPRPQPSHTRSFSALVAIPTRDGHLLEFDPLQTSPRALDALEGISDSAKKQAKVEMGRLIQATVDKWKIR